MPAQLKAPVELIVGHGWVDDLAKLLVDLALDGCWCSELDERPCMPCRAANLLERGPAELADVVQHYQTGRPIEDVAVAGGRL